MAVGGLVATGVWVLVPATLLAVAIVNEIGSEPARDDSGQITEEGDISAFDVAPEDCLNGLTEGPQVDELPVVPCAEPHDGQAYAVVELPDGDWPGQDAIVVEAESGCTERLSQDFPEVYEDPQVQLFYLHPTQSSWRLGDREIVCVAAYAEGQRTGSLFD